MAKRKQPQPQPRRPRMFLVLDQIESIPIAAGKRAAYRLRLWQGEGNFPLCLVGPVDGGPRPLEHTDHVATWVFTRHLNARDGFFFVEDNGARDLDLVHFKCANLRLLTVDTRQSVGRPLVHQAVGSVIED